MMLIGNVSKIFRMLAVIGCAVASAHVMMHVFLVPFISIFNSGYGLWNLFILILTVTGIFCLYIGLYIFLLRQMRYVPVLFNDGLVGNVIKDTKPKKGQKKGGGNL